MRERYSVQARHCIKFGFFHSLLIPQSLVHAGLLAIRKCYTNAPRAKSIFCFWFLTSNFVLNKLFGRFRVMHAATLKFMPAGQNEGFRASGLSEYGNIDPPTIIRELVQNSLDSHNELYRDRWQERGCARICFWIEDISAQSIPSYEEYCEHFISACETQEKLGTLRQAKTITDGVQSALRSSQLKVLWVIDNGRGLDAENMMRLLGDGQSGKGGPESAGSYGNGHMTSFPASDLRYVLYGGVSKEKSTGLRHKIIAGHAILASHQKEKKKALSKDCFLVDSIGEDLLDRFKFYDASVAPSVLKSKIDFVEKEFGTGAVVGILGFNRFNKFEEDVKVAEEIERVVATHFSPAIYVGGMSVEIRSPSFATRKVDRDCLQDILSKHKKRVRRDRNSIGPSGSHAWDALETLDEKYRRTLLTEAGSVTLHFRVFSEGSTHIQLYRNGMWITETIPKNQAPDFGKSKPFNALVLLDPSDAPEVCDLIRDSEGPRHINIDLQRLGPTKATRRGKLIAFLSQLHEQILALAPELEDDEFDPVFFTIEVSGDGVVQDQQSRKGRVGTPRPLPPPSPPGPDPDPGPGPGPGPTPRPNPFRRHGSRLDVKSTAVMQDGGVHVYAKPQEKAPDAELRLIWESGSDSTCDNPDPDFYMEMNSGAKINGNSVSTYAQDHNNRRVGIFLGEMLPEKEINVWIPFEKPPYGSIQVEIIKRASRDTSSK